MTGTPADAVEGRIRRWLDTAWRLWIARGVDETSGLFLESLDAHGRLGGEAVSRVRVQGRQLFCFARALLNGHEGARAPLHRGFAAVAERCLGPDGGWFHTLTVDGVVLDRRHDAYDQAFMLFGLAAVHEAGVGGAREVAERTLRFLDETLAHPEGRGLREVLPDSLADGTGGRLPRRSNPHMHLLEAMLNWHRVTGEPGFLRRANAVAELFAAHFFRAADGTLGEFFTEDWRPAAEPAGSSVEPGHHGEWNWLLHRLAAAGGRDLRPEGRRLHDWLLRHGLDAAGFAVDECGRNGEQRRRSRRLWPQCELAKSLHAVGERDAALAVAERMLDSYLDTERPGLWIDRFDADGRPDGTLVPASTLYHLVVAFEDLVGTDGV
ncbi:MAG: AGE family epimerase/isomerase [Gluconacetobacter diazotrophicus]|nr:AGE family epimerase/isomerase [Gluconacetobacter diazotrophicus]